jgi:hypothetical protein
MKFDFFQVIARIVPESYPTASNSIAWKQQNALQPLPPTTRQHVDVTSAHPFPQSSGVPMHNKRKPAASCYQRSDPPTKEPPPISILINPSSEPPTPYVSSHWESGDSRKLFAPKSIYGIDCDVQKIVLDRIEKWENAINSVADWTTLVDGCDQDNLCSEHDIFLIRHRSMYLACSSLRTLVDEETKTSRWTWQQCIEHFISLMNNIGVESYTHWRPLARWHRRLAYSPKGTFFKLPAPKSRLPPFFIKNPDSMDAFKKHRVSILKEYQWRECTRLC